VSVRPELIACADALGAVMTAQRDLYRQMLALAAREQEAIVRGSVEDLTDVVEAQSALMDHLRALETERMTALVAIEAATGIDAERATLSEIASVLPREAAGSLTRTGMDLRAQAIALREAKDLNARLLESSRALIDRWIQYLRSLLTGSIYTAHGSGAAVPGGRALDKSA
jgi:flagellar biosynthesis/type III secretory pathway chaperone